MQIKQLKTTYIDKMSKLNPWQEYPRPQLKRDSYINLNGLWDYIITKDDQIPSKFDGKILVPFCVESFLSGVGKELKNDEYIFYQRSFLVPKEFVKDIVFLHFGAIDQESVIYLNGKLVGINKGGYIPFKIDITSYLEENNILTIKVKDNLDFKYPYGKQSKNRGGMWYTPISGIWQTVWLESVSFDYIEDLKITPDIDKSSVRIKIISKSPSYNVKIYTNQNDDEKLITDLDTTKKEFDVFIPDQILWSPDNPHLYTLKINTKNDFIESYFALRKFSIGQNNNHQCFLLNNNPFFFNGLLDQGYYPDGLFLPATIDGYIFDITTMKELGFNTLRKHIKIEPLIWYYLCDKIGMIVFQDMVNNSNYSFFSDTVIPTIGLKIKSDKRVKIPLENKEIFIEHMKKTVDLLYNTPSIALWTIFNEGWGQFESERLKELLEEIDPTRLIDPTSGWFMQKNRKLESLHIYFKKVKIKKSKYPIILSEFGGYSYKDKDHAFNLDKTYGYRFYDNKDEYLAGFLKLYEEEIIPLIDKGLCASIYTQVSDVEDETNGILTYDRKVCKLDKEKVKKLNEKVKY